MLDPFTAAIGLQTAGSLFSGYKADKATKRTNELQKDFYKNGISWRVEDAKRSGIHPLYALGANVGSPSFSTFSGSGVGDALSTLGSGIMDRVNYRQQRKHELQLQQMELRNKQLQNDWLDQQIKGSAIRNASAAANVSQDPQVRSFYNLTPGPWSSADDVEDQYGGVAGEIHGLGRLSKDTYDQIISPIVEQIMQELSQQQSPKRKKQTRRGYR